MKKLPIIAALVLLFTGCGNLRVTPKGCKTDAVWGASPTSTREITREELNEEKGIEIKSKDDLYVFDDHEINLRELIEEAGMKCENIKNLRVVIETSWFFKRTVTLIVVKK